VVHMLAFTWVYQPSPTQRVEITHNGLRCLCAIFSFTYTYM